MKDESCYQFEARTRYASSTNHARCNGFIASSTNCKRFAAEAAAAKAFSAMCRSLKMDPEKYTTTSKEILPEVWLVLFHRCA